MEFSHILENRVRQKGRVGTAYETTSRVPGSDRFKVFYSNVEVSGSMWRIHFKTPDVFPVSINKKW